MAYMYTNITRAEGHFVCACARENENKECSRHIIVSRSLRRVSTYFICARKRNPSKEMNENFIFTCSTNTRCCLTFCGRYWL